MNNKAQNKAFIPQWENIFMPCDNPFSAEICFLNISNTKKFVNPYNASDISLNISCGRGSPGLVIPGYLHADIILL